MTDRRGLGPVVDALDGLRVVDVTTGPVGGLATMLLGDFGADVIKVEPPGGDRFRSLAAAPLWLRGKRSYVADLRTPGGVEDLRVLISNADVLVVGGPPSRAHRWGIDAESARGLHPGLVHCSITGWGPTGPRAEVPGYEGAVSAASGRMLAFHRQLRRGGPVFAAVGVATHAAAHGAAQGILAGLLARARGAGFQRVETSLLQGILPHDLAELLIVEMAVRRGVELPNLSSVGGDLPTLNYHPVRTGDGRWIQCGNLLEHLLYAFLEATGLLGDMITDPRFADRPSTWDADAVEAARDLILTRLQERTADEWMDIFRANGNVAAEPFETTAEALEHPDLVANGAIVTIDHDDLGPVRMIGPVASLSRTPARISRPAPRPGQHQHEIKAEILSSMMSPPVPATRRSRTTPSTGSPLEGITVLEFATLIAAPLGSSMLADLGARVIKVEPVNGDPYRQIVARGTGAAKSTAGKSSICVDLRTPEGQRIALALARRADIVVHNTRPGVAERLGVGEEQLRAVNPELIFVSVTGYGPHGPGSHRPSTHPCAGAASGGATFQAGAALEAPCETLDEVREISRQLMRANDACADPNTAVVVASAALVALLARERLGFGQAVRVDMLTANMHANADDALAYAGKPPRPTSGPELYGPSALYRLYRCADGWVFLAVTSEGEWQRCCEVLGRRDLADDPRHSPGPRPADHGEALAEALAEQFLTASASCWEERFRAARLAVVQADAATPGRFFSADPHVLANEFSPFCTHPRFGLHRRWGPLVRVEGGLGAYGPGVLAGQHTDDILAELGEGPDRVAALREAGVVGSEPAEL